jgi:hypothetical protein
VVRVVAFAILLLSSLSASIPPHDPSADSPTARFLSAAPETLHSFRAQRRLEAHNDRFKQSGWLDVLTDYGPAGLFNQVIAEGGSELIRRKVLHAALEGERDLTAGKAAGALTEANYVFADDGIEGEWARIRVTPRRKDRTLVEGVLLVSPETADLVEVRGHLARTPSFWVTKVQVQRRYGRVSGVRVPVSMDSRALVRLAGASTFSMRYVYEMVNDIAVGR